jgi:hypothetical protein
VTSSIGRSRSFVSSFVVDYQHDYRRVYP